MLVIDLFQVFCKTLLICSNWNVLTGHEAGGVVVEVGADVNGINVGDKVAIDPNRGCHNCRFCRRAEPQFCPKGSFNDGIGIIRNGGFAEFLVAPAEQVYKVRDDFEVN